MTSPFNLYFDKFRFYDLDALRRDTRRELKAFRGSKKLTGGTVNASDIARVAHEANRAYCVAIGDNSQVPWDEAPNWQKMSAEDGVKGVMERGVDPRKQHEQWLALKSAEGWKYGPVKDAAAKTHPCFVPYDELPPEQKVKDSLFGAVCAVLIPLL